MKTGHLGDTAGLLLPSSSVGLILWLHLSQLVACIGTEPPSPRLSSPSRPLLVVPTRLPAPSTRALDVEYPPLLAGQCNSDHDVEATCAELGTFVFGVALQPQVPTDLLVFARRWATRTFQTIRFQHLLADKAEDKVTVDSADFIVDSAAVSAPAAGERPPAGVCRGDFTQHFLSPASEDAGVSVDVRFEPTGFGERNGRLVLPSLLRETSYAFSRAAPSPLALHAQLKTWSDYAVVAVTLPSRTFTPRPQRLPSRVTSVPWRAPTMADRMMVKIFKINFDFSSVAAVSISIFRCDAS
jgi:hypothetical protein